MKINLLEALKNVDKSEMNSTWPCYNEFFNEFDIEYWNTKSEFHDQWDKRMKSYYLIKWLCTDTWVGALAYYLDDELVAYSWQPARKSDTTYYFVSDEAANKVKEFLYSLIDEQEPHYKVMDLNEEIDVHYTVDYGSQLLVDEGQFDGETVKVVQRWNRYEDIDNWKKVIVRMPDGRERMINLDQFHIPLHMKKES